MKKLLSALGLIIALGSTPTQARDPSSKFFIDSYILTGNSTTNDVPAHIKMGFTISEEITKGSSWGLDHSTLFEGKNYETSLGFRHINRSDNHSHGFGFGISRVRFDEPIYLYENDGTEKRTDKENVLYFELNLSRKLINNLNTRVNYQRNFARDEILRANYPKDRLSIGLEYKIEF
jgi:hypothetical protein